MTLDNSFLTILDLMKRKKNRIYDKIASNPQKHNGRKYNDTI